MDNVATPSVTDYVALKDNPELLLNLLDKYVKIELIKNYTFEGFIDSIDPITSSIILLIPYKEAYQTTILPGYAIINILEIESNNIKPPSDIKPEVASEKDITDRKKKIIAWLKLNFLPVSESEDKIIFGSASLVPPYTVDDIYTNNPMVVMEVRKILERIPEDFNPIDES